MTLIEALEIVADYAHAELGDRQNVKLAPKDELDEALAMIEIVVSRGSSFFTSHQEYLVLDILEEQKEGLE